MLSWPEMFWEKEMRMQQGKARPKGGGGALTVSAVLWELVPS